MAHVRQSIRDNVVTRRHRFIDYGQCELHDPRCKIDDGTGITTLMLGGFIHEIAAKFKEVAGRAYNWSLITRWKCPRPKATR